MYYASWDFHVKSPFAGPDWVPWMKLSEPWQMSLLFMISGAVTATLLKKGPNLKFVRQRSARLLLPLLCVCFLSSHLSLILKSSRNFNTLAAI